jgi:diacylglycerol O-acyltransferase
VKHPSAGVRDVLAMVVGLSHYARRLIVTHPTTSIQGEIGSRRLYAFARASMSDLQHIRHAFGCTINDVVLAAVSGGYRALLEARGDRPADALVRSLVPASVREADARGVFDNRISAIICDLPVHLADPVARLRDVAAQMTHMKGSHMVEAGVWFMEIGDLAPPMLVGTISRLVARAMHRVPQGSLGTVTTNVPGPREPLYLLGRRLLEWLPYVPITQGVRVGTAMLSYAGQLVFGITADRDSVPDLTVFTRAIDAAIAELRARATAEAAGPPRTA